MVRLVKLSNEAAVKLGFRDFYALQLALNEQDETSLLGFFDQLDALTTASFTEAKTRIDGVQARRLDVPAPELMPWDYTDRFFQEAPNLSDVDMDAPLAGKDIGKLVASFYRGIGLDAEPILARSDLYEHKGKNPHAFSQDIDRNGDVRALLNIKPNQTWLGTTPHELGHGVHEYNINRSLPNLLRVEDSIFATEGFAMMMERLAENAAFYRAMALVDETTLAKLGAPMEEKERMQEEVAQIRVEATAGGGMVTVKMDGQKNVLGVKIDPEVAGDVEMLQDMVMAACNEAAKKVDEETRQKMSGIMGGLGLPPGLF